jgi:glutamine cyclotransferase
LEEQNMCADRSSKTTNRRSPAAQPAEVVREYGPFPGVDTVHGLTFDGKDVWFATNRGLHVLDPQSGTVTRRLDVPCDAGTAFDGRHIYQLADAAILKIDPKTGEVVGTLPAPGQGRDSGLTWAEGKLWVGQYRDRKIICIDPDTGRVLKTIDSERFVTGVTWLDGDLWHGTWEAEASDLRRVDPETGDVLDRVTMPDGTGVSGLESDGGDLLYCGGGASGKVRAVKRPAAH